MKYNNVTEQADAMLCHADEEILRLRGIIRSFTEPNRKLYEVDDTITIWATPEGNKTSIESKVVRGIRAL